MKLSKTLPAIPALFPGADLFIRSVSTPADYTLLFKIATSVICIVLVGFSIRPKSRKKALWVSGIGAGLLVIYLVVASLLIYSNPHIHREGDNSVIGLWPEPAAVDEVAKKGWSWEAERANYGPEEWTQIYGRPAQLCSAVILMLFYTSAFCLLTYGFAGLPSE